MNELILKSLEVGDLTRSKSKYLLKWNYTTCGSPITTNFGLGDGAGAKAAGFTLGVLFPGEDGELYPSSMTGTGAFTTTGMEPQIEGTIIATDAGSTAVGWNVQLDGETTDNCGMQLSPGSGVSATPANKYVVGTHSGHIDVTFWTSDWTDYDCVAIGFRKVEALALGHNAIVATGAAGDGVYTDFAAFGAMTDTDMRTMTDLNNSGTSVATDVGIVPVDSDNMRVKVNLSSAGVVTYESVVNAEAGAGVLAEPSGTAAFTFDDGDVLIPYIVTLKAGAADVELLIKDIEIYRTPGIPSANG